MSQIIGQIDSLAALLSKLRDNRINHINTLDEIISFQNDFQNKLNKSKDKVEKAFVSEIEQLKQSIITLETTYKGKLLIRERVLIKEKNEIDINIDHSSQNSTDIISEFFNFFKRLILKCRKYLLSNYFDAVKNLSYLVNKIQISIKKHRLQYFEKNFNSIVEKRNYKESKEIVKIKSILDENNTLIPGAIGEQKAVDELKKLPDSYVVINNCKIEFIPPIYYKKNDQNIKRIQADHIVVGPSGVFLIETKNWSMDSIRNLEFNSPVEQINRTNHALFIYLNKSNTSFKHNWGSIKISIRNIILMINSKPEQEFQFVKILSLKEICNYITYFKPIFSNKQIHQLVKLLQNN